VAVHTVSDEVMQHLTSTVTPQGVVAICAFIDGSLDALPGDARFVVVLHQVRDPGNAGTILRSADGAGADAVVFTRSSVDAYNEKTVRATAGSLFHVLIVREIEASRAVEFLRERGFSVLAADPVGRHSIYEADLRGPTAVLFGNEAAGLTEEALALADDTVRVPIAGRVESLNLAAAATVVLFEAARQRDSRTPDVFR
jgi:TrmH family RNA methyltransferase